MQRGRLRLLFDRRTESDGAGSTGREYSAPPKEMIVEAVLSEVYGGAPVEPAKIVRPETALENLARFFEAKRRKELAGAA